MKSRETLIQLIEQLAVFENENKHLEHYGPDDFLSFIQSRTHRDEVDQPFRSISGNKKPKGFNFKENAAVLLSRQVSLIYRYAKEYTKKALEGSALQTVEEFSYLVVLMTYDKLSKTALIQKNVMGKTSGTEVIKRLLKKELIKQFPDEKDKRSRLVAITAKGLKEMKKVFPKMQMASEIITGNLTISEQNTLLFLLQKLDAYHNGLFLNHRDEDLEKLVKIDKAD